MSPRRGSIRKRLSHAVAMTPAKLRQLPAAGAVILSFENVVVPHGSVKTILDQAAGVDSADGCSIDIVNQVEMVSSKRKPEVHLKRSCEGVT